MEAHTLTLNNTHKMFEIGQLANLNTHERQLLLDDSIDKKSNTVCRFTLDTGGKVSAVVINTGREFICHGDKSITQQMIGSFNSN